MSWFDVLKSALSALLAYPARSILTSLGVTVGVAAVVAMTAVGLGAQDRVQKRVQSIGANLLVVFPDFDSSSAGTALFQREPTLDEDDIRAISTSVPDVVGSGSAVAAEAQLLHGNQNAAGLTYGISPGYLEARNWQVAKGRPLVAEDFRRGSKVALLGQTLAKTLFGDSSPVGGRVLIDNTPVIVVGLLKSKGRTVDDQDQDSIVLLPMKTAKSHIIGAGGLVYPRSVDFAILQARNPESVEVVRRNVETLLRQRHRLKLGQSNDFQVDNLTQLTGVYAENERAFSILLASIALVSLVVGGISIANIMLVAVAERTREIGIRLAVGARPTDIQRQFLAEATCLAVAGGIAGLVLGAVVAGVLSWWGDWDILVDPLIAAVALILSVGVGVAAGFYPALRASKLDPAVAIRRG